MTASAKEKAWLADQIAKSEYFHNKLHEWSLMEVAEKIAEVKGETLDWNISFLEISDKAWNKVIHRGIKPIIVFAHPSILTSVPGSVGYYRMLSMVSQKSMINIKLASKIYENGKVIKQDLAYAMSKRLNKIISMLIEADETLDSREFDIWRGMAAGAQAQGSWNPNKGKIVEQVIKNIMWRRLREKGWIASKSESIEVEKKEVEVDGLETEDVTEEEQETSALLSDKRVVKFANEPDAAIYDEHGKIIAAIEIKGGIDTAGVLERVGATIKSLSRAKEENPDSVTILIIQGVSVTVQAETDLKAHKTSVNYWFTIEDFLEDEQKREEVFNLLNI